MDEYIDIMKRKGVILMFTAETKILYRTQARAGGVMVTQKLRQVRFLILML